ncbi:hypothetical protein ACFQ2B_21410 [Streptomyces stramineus]
MDRAVVRPGGAQRRLLLALPAHGRRADLPGRRGDGTGGLNLYAHHPELQMGPISFLVAGLFNPFSEHTGQFLAAAFMSALGLVIVVLAGRSAAISFLGTGTNHQRLRRVLVAGLAFIPMWIEVSVRFGHLDDVLALFFTALAVWFLTRCNPAAVGACLALAMDSKPTALAFLPLILALPRDRWMRAVLWCAGLVAVAWLPFFLVDPQSFAAAKFTIPNNPASALRWLGADDPETPSWARPAQAALGLGLGAIAVWRGRWAGWSCWARTPGSSWTPASTRTTPRRCCWAPCCGTCAGSGGWCRGGAGSR